MAEKKECCENCQFCVSIGCLAEKGICDLEDSFVYLKEDGCYNYIERHSEYELTY